MSRKHIGKCLAGFGVRALPRYKPEQEIRPRRKDENSYNNCLQRSKRARAIHLSPRLGGNRMAVRATAHGRCVRQVLPARFGVVAIDFFNQLG